jgi:hypothetical protein
MSNYGSTRTKRLHRGVRVLCTKSRVRPARTSTRTGIHYPETIETKVLSGTVLVDQGHSIYVKVKYPSGATRDMSFFPHEVSLDANYHKGLSASGV